MGIAAPPPAAPPPPPPPSDSDHHSVRSITTIENEYEDHHHQQQQQQNSNYDDAYGGSSYQQATTTSKSRSATVPIITNYGLSPAQHQLYPSNSNVSSHSQEQRSQQRKSTTVRGDVSLRPNTGNTNQEIGAAFGSLREIASTLRWMTIATTITAIFWEGFAFPARIITVAFVQPAKVVLGAYLGIFCLLILGVELNAPLRDNFGFLYNPLTRGLTLLLMCTMCFGILKSWWECILGVAFVTCGMGYIYTYIKYPEYRRWQDYNANRPTTWREARQYWMGSNVRTSAWANPDDGQERTAWDVINQTSNEAQALLHSSGLYQNSQ
jgi:hypothetical protein